MSVKSQLLGVGVTGLIAVAFLFFLGLVKPPYTGIDAAIILVGFMVTAAVTGTAHRRI